MMNASEMMSLRRGIAPLWYQRIKKTSERSDKEIEEAEKFVVVFKHLPTDIQRAIADFVPSVFEMVSLSGRILKMRLRFSQADLDARQKFEKLPKKVWNEIYEEMHYSGFTRSFISLHFDGLSVKKSSSRKLLNKWFTVVLFHERHIELVIKQFSPFRFLYDGFYLSEERGTLTWLKTIFDMEFFLNK
jgi:hypothetical protein